MDNDLINKIKAQLYDRASSPVLLAFTVSWITWNIRTVLVIFSKNKIDEKFNAIDRLYPHTWSYFLQGIFYPAICALLFIAIYPYFARLAFWHWQKEHIKIKKTQQRLEDETPATQEEINALRKASLEQVASLQSEIREAYDLIKEYKAREQEVSATNIELNAHVTSLDETMKSKNLDLNLISDQNKVLNAEVQRLEALIRTQSIVSLEKPVLVDKSNDSSDLIPKSLILKDSEEAIKVFKKIKNISDFKKFTDDEIEMIMQLAINDGKIKSKTFREINDHLSEIEFDYCVENLESSNIISLFDENVNLSSIGKQLIVKNGVSKITTNFEKEFLKKKM